MENHKYPERMKKLTALLSLLACSATISCSHRHTEPITGKTVNVENPHIANGQLVFNRYCQKCHPAGEAGLGPETLHKPGFARAMQVRHGFGVMPRFGKDLISRRDMHDINAYLNALKHLKHDRRDEGVARK